jgi:uncharacterized protein (TIGR02217 family)
MSFHDVRFPIDLSFGFSGGPAFDVDITKTKAGIEQRNLNKEFPQATYTAPYNNRDDEGYGRILDFYYARNGKAYGFRYKDWRDYLARSQLVGMYTGSSNQFQLKKVYGDEANTYTRIITKPVIGTLIIYVNGNLIMNWNCNYLTGIVTIPGLTGTVSQPDKIYADFEFDVSVRFDNDFPQEATESAGEFISVGTIKFLELIDE